MPMSQAVTYLLAGALTAAAPTSEIPARREFPVDPKASPCSDFYAHACNRALAGFKLRDDRSAHTFAFNDSSERLLIAKQKFFADLVASTKEPTPRTRELRDVYKACMNVDAAKRDEKGYVEKTLKETDSISDPRAFRAFVEGRVLSRDFGVFHFGAAANQDDPDKYDLYVLPQLQTLPERSYYAKEDVIKDYQEVLTHFFKTLGKEKPELHAKAVIDFEKGFAETYPLPAEFREIYNSPTGITRSELQATYPYLPLHKLLAKVPQGVHIRNLAPKNFAWLNDAFVKLPLETLRDVYTWGALADYMDDGYPEFFDKWFAFSNKHLGGPEKRPPREERCTRYVMNHFAKEIDAELVDVVFPNFPTEKFVAMTEKVRAAIVFGLEANTWLTPDVKKRAAEKMKTATLQLVKPANEAEWDFHPAADYDAEKPIENQRLWQEKRQEKTIARFATARNRKQWDMGPLTVNAYYSSSDNKFVMPIGILQYPFYDPSGPDEANFGAIGAVIGHELGHGVDDKGSRYDEKGRLAPWMGEKDLAEFKKRSARLVDQFAKAGHDGELTLGENIGDLVGVTFAYRAAFPKNVGTAEAKKAFFLQYARAWCSEIRPKYKERLLKTDSHALGYARVNEQMKHQFGFAEAFGCKVGDQLYLPEAERVSIW